MRARTYHLGTIAGFRVRIHPSWLIILVLLTATLATGWFPQALPGETTGFYWSVGFLATLLLFASVLAHELAHALVARAHQLPIEEITLFLFGGVADLKEEPKRAGSEFQIAVVGPLTSLAIGALSLAGWLALAGSVPLLPALLVYLGVSNLALGVFNLLPGFPLDGGRVLRSILWKLTGSLPTATRWATRVGQGIAYLFLVFGVWQVFGGDVLGGLWIGFVGWFLLNAARAANAQVTLETLLGGVTVGEVMRAVPVRVPANISLRRAVEDYLAPNGLRAALVTQGDWLMGLLTLGEVTRVPQAEWETTPVGFVMIPRARLPIAAPEQRLREVLALMGRERLPLLPVERDGLLVGLLTGEAISRFLEIRQALGGRAGGHAVGRRLPLAS
ncbi:MAG TPA: site-2 protease family protein [Ktedonobacterales bacterium]